MLFCIHSWTTYHYDCQRSCIKCKLIQSAGYTEDDDDWHPTQDYNVKRALRHFVLRLIGSKEKD